MSQRPSDEPDNPYAAAHLRDEDQPGGSPPAEAAQRRKQRRRRLGLVMILTSIVLVLLGQFVLDAYLEGDLVRFVLYWTLCALFTLASLLTAAMDMMAVRRDAAREERHLMMETFAKGKASHKARADEKDEK